MMPHVTRPLVALTSSALLLTAAVLVAGSASDVPTTSAPTIKVGDVVLLHGADRVSDGTAGGTTSLRISNVRWEGNDRPSFQVFEVASGGWIRVNDAEKNQRWINLNNLTGFTVQNRGPGK